MNFANDQFREIMSGKPRGSGAAVLAAIFLLTILAILVFVIPWKQHILLPVRLLPAEAAMPLHTARDGQIIDIKSDSGNLVQRGEVIATVGDARKLTTARELKFAAVKILEAVERSSPFPPLPAISIPEELQPAQQSLQKEVLAANVVINDRSIALISQSNRDRVIGLRRQKLYISKQIALAEKARDLTETRLAGQRDLVRKGWIKRPYTFSAEKDVYDQEQRGNDARVAQIAIEQNIANLLNSTSYQQAQRSTDIARAQAAVLASATALLNQIAWFEETCFVRASISGRLTIDGDLKVGAFLKRNSRMGMITARNGRFTAVGIVPAGSPKTVRLGQRAKIESASYPGLRFGYLDGIVSKVAHIEHNGTYLIEVTIPKGAVTNRGFDIPSRVNLAGQARVTVGQARLIERFFF